MGTPRYSASGGAKKKEVSSSSLLIKVGVSEAKILAPLGLDPAWVSGNGSGALALRSDESDLGSSYRQIERCSGEEEQRMKKQTCPPCETFLKSEPLTL